MRQEFKEILNEIEETSRLGFAVKKGSLLSLAEEKLSQADAQLADFEKRFPELETALSKANTDLAQIQLREKLVASLLKAKGNNKGVRDYFHYLENDFIQFANQESSLVEEAQAILTLQEIGNELKMIGAYPEFYKKRTIAIAGGFSAGKSEFISSLFKDKSIRLPIGIEPTTAIPAYVIAGKSNSVLGLSSNGGMIDLTEIDPDFHHKLSHQFIKEFGFNLKNIMPNIFLTTPMEYQNLCFIDTPGYNPSDSENGFTSEDEQTAKDFVQRADAIIWLIGLDSNGTIPQSDLDFLQNVMSDEKPLYLVLNKADLRPYDQLEEVLEVIIETLDDYDVHIKGISAYSSIRGQEILFRQCGLFDFLHSINQPSSKHREMVERLYEVDLKYQKAILGDIKRYDDLRGKLNSLNLDLVEEGLDNWQFHDRIDELKKAFSTEKFHKDFNQLGEQIKKLRQAIDDVFGDFGDLLDFERQVLNVKNFDKQPEQRSQTVREIVSIRSPVDDFIEEVCVEEGDFVTEGQCLIKFSGGEKLFAKQSGKIISIVDDSFPDEGQELIQLEVQSVSTKELVDGLKNINQTSVGGLVGGWLGLLDNSEQTDRQTDRQARDFFRRRYRDLNPDIKRKFPDIW